ncbi:DNA primase noncatalytic subunit PriX [Candidatus Nitrosocosmicus arcticus]|uniref:Eukaryotic-type DNA primase large subunit n=1 Tax=Candidatus Nitrosocosmicus arcticus TaxID=2035267 RepID=A0A557SUA6_9ARCH|nr:DNA primase noncatalytic subunit PriX [Candidatus Nitrosocosmicus arcticus]TVP40182.1 Eukaryotic-type DNA primase large subunit [Candidatus Nitrosocosmicus arcticus]
MTENNVHFILTHFSGQEFEFPRSIMTARTNGQVFVDSEDEMMKYFTEANFVDCRINGYPAHNESEMNQLYPSFIFIDLDLSLCSTCKYPIRKLDYILKQTLKKIKEEIDGQSTVLWTGGGYHIYQPIKIVTKNQEKQPLETFKELEEFAPFTGNDLTTEFIRFAENYLTDGKGDSKHNPSINSCLIRIPETINSKYNEKVKIIQKWDDIEALANPLVLHFLDHLIQLKIENEELKKRKQNSDSIRNSNKIAWIDKLLETPIADYRYYCLWHILIPYLVTIKSLSEHEVVSILTEWLDRCNKVNKIRWKYPQRIMEQLRYDKGYPPISLENLKKENLDLYNLLKT